MSPYLISFAELVWAWVLAPPLHWAMSLPLEWKIELSGFVLLCALHRHLIEYWIVGQDSVSGWWEGKKWDREWQYYSRMEYSEFHTLIASLRARAQKEDDRAAYLERGSGSGFVGSILRKAASRREDRAERLRWEATRLRRLWDTIQTERRAEDERRRRKEDDRQRRSKDERPNMRDKILLLMRNLESGSELAAVNALSELNRIRSAFDWESLAPIGISEAQRERLINVLKLMAGTTSVGEARNALRTARRILEQNHCDWQWEPA